MASSSMIVQKKRKADFRKTVTPYMYLIPAFIVMTIITFYQ